MNRAKYIITADGYVIVFSECIYHSEFAKFKPISAGFISFGIDKSGNPTCSCYGESISLNLASRPERDTELAKRQLNIGNY
jgi:hypothetical protein